MVRIIGDGQVRNRLYVRALILCPLLLRLLTSTFMPENHPQGVFIEVRGSDDKNASMVFCLGGTGIAKQKSSKRDCDIACGFVGSVVPALLPALVGVPALFVSHSGWNEESILITSLLWLAS